MRSRVATAALVAATLSLPIASGGERKHTVRAGETAGSIAESYYGKSEMAGALLAFNGKSSSLIRIGESLRIPICPVHEVRPGESWSLLAKRYLGAAERYRTLAALNGADPRVPLEIGQRVVIPVAREHRLAPGESLALLAERHYGDAQLGQQLADYNGIEDPRRLSVGAVVEIPQIDFVPAPGPAPPRGRSSSARERRAAGPAPEPSPTSRRRIETPPRDQLEQEDASPAAGSTAASPPTSGKRIEMPSSRERAERDEAAPGAGPTASSPPTSGKRTETRPGKPREQAESGSGAEGRAGSLDPARVAALEAGLRRAMRLYEDADYEGALETLTRVRAERFDDNGDAVRLPELWRALAFVHVAFDDEQAACDAWSHLPPDSPLRGADPSLVSPKIRDILDRCP